MLEGRDQALVAEDPVAFHAAQPRFVVQFEAARAGGVEREQVVQAAEKAVAPRPVVDQLGHVQRGEEHPPVLEPSRPHVAAHVRPHGHQVTPVSRPQPRILEPELGPVEVLAVLVASGQAADQARRHVLGLAHAEQEARPVVPQALEGDAQQVVLAVVEGAQRVARDGRPVEEGRAREPEGRDHQRPRRRLAGRTLGQGNHPTAPVVAHLPIVRIRTGIAFPHPPPGDTADRLDLRMDDTALERHRPLQPAIGVLVLHGAVDERASQVALVQHAPVPVLRLEPVPHDELVLEPGAPPEEVARVETDLVPLPALEVAGDAEGPAIAGLDHDGHRLDLPAEGNDADPDVLDEIDRTQQALGVGEPERIDLVTLLEQDVVPDRAVAGVALEGARDRIEDGVAAGLLRVPLLVEPVDLADEDDLDRQTGVGGVVVDQVQRLADKDLAGGRVVAEVALQGAVEPVAVRSGVRRRLSRPDGRRSGHRPGQGDPQQQGACPPPHDPSHPAALLELATAAAETGVVAPDLGLLAHHGLAHARPPFPEVPVAVDPVERGDLVVDLLLPVVGVGRDELDLALVMVGAAPGRRDDLQAVPGRVLGPVPGPVAVVRVAAGRVQALVDEVELGLGVGRIPGAHERLGGGGLHLAGDDRLAAGLVGEAGSTGTVHVCSAGSGVRVRNRPLQPKRAARDPVRVPSARAARSAVEIIPQQGEGDQRRQGRTGVLGGPVPQPKMASSISPPSTPARSTACRTTCPPSVTGWVMLKPPRKAFAIGVLAVETITASLVIALSIPLFSI